MSFTAKKNILNFLSVVCLISWVLFIYFYFFHFQNSAPTKPNPETGQIYEVNNHGYLFYLTKDQKTEAFVPLFIAIACLAIVAVLEWRWKVYRRIYVEPPKRFP